MNEKYHPYKLDSITFTVLKRYKSANLFDNEEDFDPDVDYAESVLPNAYLLPLLNILNYDTIESLEDALQNEVKPIFRFLKLNNNDKRAVFEILQKVTSTKLNDNLQQKLSRLFDLKIRSDFKSETLIIPDSTDRKRTIRMPFIESGKIESTIIIDWFRLERSESVFSVKFSVKVSLIDYLNPKSIDDIEICRVIADQTLDNKENELIVSNWLRINKLPLKLAKDECFLMRLDHAIMDLFEQTVYIKCNIDGVAVNSDDEDIELL